MSKICSVIITYNFNDDFIKGFKSVYTQVDHIIIVDNSSNPLCIEKLMKINKLDRVDVIFNNKNYGIAKAINQGIEKANLNKYEWILTLDHDSVIENNYIDKIIKVLREIDDSKIGIVCPNVYDLNLSEYMFTTEIKYSYVEKCIQSGALFNTQMLKEVGVFNEELFIYYVDEDMCERARNKNYNILRVNKAIIFHKDGNMEKKKILWKEFDFNKRSKHATYYRARNCIFMSKRYSYKYLKDNIRDPIKILFYDNERLSKLKYYLIGLCDGLINKYGEIDNKYNF